MNGLKSDTFIKVHIFIITMLLFSIGLYLGKIVDLLQQLISL